MNSKRIETIDQLHAHVSERLKPFSAPEKTVTRLVGHLSFLLDKDGHFDADSSLFDFRARYATAPAASA